MPLQLRTTTLSAAVCSAGIRCYTKTVDGEVREACNDTSNANLSKEIKSNNIAALETREEWYPGTLRFRCSPDSSLCTFAWAPWNQSIFYQSEDYVLREKRRDHGDWADTDFAQVDCMPGTNLAAIHSKNAERVVLFWQDREGWICYRRAEKWVWDEEPMRLCKAAEGTGIGATSWNDLVDIRVYYQDEYHVIREFRGGFDSSWKLVDGFTLKYNTSVGDITAISWTDPSDVVEVRLYLQDDDDVIIEWCNSGKGWYRGEFKEPALPEADITAFARDVQTDPGYLITAMWTGQNQMLYQRVYPGALKTWLKPTAVTDLQNAGTNVGVWVGEHFSDNCPGIDAKAISKIHVKAGEVLDGISLEYDDGACTPWHGGDTGKSREFVLEKGEDVTQVLVSFNEKHVQGLQFVTSKGCESPWYGKQSDTPLLWEYKGHALAGFIGTVGDHINGLKPFWSSRHASSSALTLEENIKLATRIGKDIKLSTTHIASLQTRTEVYTQSVTEGLTAPAQSAMQGIAQFITAVEYLHELVQLSKTAKAEGKRDLVYREEDVKVNVGRCQKEATDVAESFRLLAAQSNQLIPEGEQINQEVVNEVDGAQSRAERLAEIHEAAKGFRLNAEVKQKDLRIARDQADKDMREAQLAKDRAQEKRETKAAYKFVRDVVTLGIGNRYDMFHLNKNIADIDGLIALKKAELNAARSRLEDATSSIAKVDADLTRVAELASTTEGHLASLQGVTGTMEGLVAKNKDLAQASSELSTLLNKMHVSSEELDDHSSVEKFARGVLHIGQLADASAWLKDLMGDRALVFQQTIRKIAGMPEDAL